MTKKRLLMAIKTQISTTMIMTAFPIVLILTSTTMELTIAMIGKI